MRGKFTACRCWRAGNDVLAISRKYNQNEVTKLLERSLARPGPTRDIGEWSLLEIYIHVALSQHLAVELCTPWLYTQLQCGSWMNFVSRRRWRREREFLRVAERGQWRDPTGSGRTVYVYVGQTCDLQDDRHYWRYDLSERSINRSIETFTKVDKQQRPHNNET